MSTSITPRLGQIVLYTLTDNDADVLMRRRRDAGLTVRSGNDLRGGDTYPAMIVRDWAPNPEHAKINRKVADVLKRTLEPGVLDTISVNLQVLLDGNDSGWVTSRSKFDPKTHGRWVQHVRGEDHELPSGLPTDEGKASEDIVFRPDPSGHWRDLAADWL